MVEIAVGALVLLTITWGAAAASAALDGDEVPRWMLPGCAFALLWAIAALVFAAWLVGKAILGGPI